MQLFLDVFLTPGDARSDPLLRRNGVRCQPLSVSHAERAKAPSGVQDASTALRSRIIDDRGDSFRELSDAPATRPRRQMRRYPKRGQERAARPLSTGHLT